jgi:hypothetical protein
MTALAVVSPSGASGQRGNRPSLALGAGRLAVLDLAPSAPAAIGSAAELAALHSITSSAMARNESFGLCPLRFRDATGAALMILSTHAIVGAAIASTVSPIFHTLDAFRGTLIFDEADFRFSDERSEIVKFSIMETFAVCRYCGQS